MRLLTSLILLISLISVISSLKCWYDVNTVDQLSDSAEAHVCDCGESCAKINAVPSGNETYWVRLCGCGKSGQNGEEYESCPNGQPNDKEWSCCKGDLCNKN
ncbi:unnamed protein product, partial [Mesorhabditis belari]|uniref:Uncharacterized protein n=1 Tax=Mesorhabditis belari TaxID=2138241 RepID=A0AAF3ELR6_9BILA